MHIPDRVPDCRYSVHPYARRTLVETSPAFFALRPVSPRTKSVFSELLRPVHHGDDLVRNRVVDFRRHRLVGFIGTDRVDADMGVAVGDLSLPGQRRPKLLRLWLGNNA